ncbi:MAG: polysaccharide deacetylase family protein [Pyrinomonadaceae bacterium]
MSSVALGLGGVTVSARKPSPQIALTMDDFSWANAIRLSPEERNQAILGALEKHSVKAALFVVGRNVESDQGKRLLADWDKAGHLIANHTYSHRNYGAPAMTAVAYEQDILRAEDLLKAFPHFKKYFRFPMLKEGETAGKRDALRSSLTQHGYRMGYVTIDNSDWIVDQRLRSRLEKDPKAKLDPYRDFYLQHMWDRAQYYDSLARKVLGRAVKHTILTHFNLLNALFLEDLMQMFKSKGWQWIDAEETLADPVFNARPKIVPAGESIVWALAKESGKIPAKLRYPAEDGEYENAKMNKLGL